MAPITTLTIVINANTANLNQAFAGAVSQVNAFGNSFGGVSTNAIAMGVTLGNVFTKIIGYVQEAMVWVAKFALKIGKDAVEASTHLNSAMIGLMGVAKHFGVPMNQAAEAARNLAADGLLPVRDAAKGLQNLLATGFNLEQSIQLMNAFKNSAVFLRQEHFSLAEAVRTATEGLRNSRSVQVDNAGITKNLSQIMKEYGFQLQDIADPLKGAEARQALFNGVMREAAPMMGLAGVALQTYEGQTASLSAAYTNLLATLGDFVTQNTAVSIAIGAIGDVLRWFNQVLKDNRSLWLLVVDVLAFVARAFAAFLDGLYYVKAGVDALDTAVRYVLLGLQKVVADFVGGFLDDWNKLNRAGKTAIEIFRPGTTAFFDNLAKVQERLAGKIKETEAAIAANKRSTEEWGLVLHAGSAALRDTARAMEATKGAAIDLTGALNALPPRAEDAGRANDAAAKKAQKAWEKFQAWFAKNQPGLREGISGRVGYPLGIPKIPQEVLNYWEMLKGAPGFKIGLGGTLPGERLPMPKPPRLDQVREAFRDLAAELPQMILDAFRADTFLGALAGAAGTMGAIFAKRFGQALADAKFYQRGLTGGEKALGLAGMGLEAFSGGFSLGASAGRTKGALGGAASGALSGAMMGSILPGIGTAVGAVVGGAAGFFGGLFGGGKKAAEERRQLAANKQALLDQYGGMEKLTKLAERLGVNIKTAFDAKKPEQFEAAVTSLNKAIEEQKQRMEGLGQAVEGVNKRAAIFASNFTKAVEARDKAKEGLGAADLKDEDRVKLTKDLADATGKIAEIAQRVQPQFERLGTVTAATFRGLVKETGSALGAIRELEPTLKILDQAVREFGLTNTAVTEELLANYRLVTDEAFKPMFEAIEADQQILQGLVDASALSPAAFQALAADIGENIQGIIDKGGDMSRTLALSAPVLQTLWEQQQIFGKVTDETTAALLAEAEAQGIVGNKFKETNQKILDVLLAIGEVLGAKLPEYLTNLPTEDAAKNIEDAFRDIKIEIPVEFVYPDGLPPGYEGAEGAGPTMGLAAPAPAGRGVAPLSGAQLGVSGGSWVTNVYLDGERIARNTAKRMPKVLRGMGV